MWRESFVLYTKINEIVKELSVEDKGLLFQAILDYQETGVVPDISGAIKIAFIGIRQDLDANAEKYEQVRKARSEAGKKGMESRWITKDNKNNKVKDEITNITVYDNVNVNDNDNVNVVNYTYMQLIELFNAVCVSLPKVTRLSDKRKQKLKARLKSFTEDEIKASFILTEQSDFLSGRSSNWKASFDWLINSDSNMLKVLEGNYANNDNVAMTKEERLRKAYEELQRSIYE